MRTIINVLLITLFFLVFLLAGIAYGQTGNIFVDENHNGKRIYNIATPTLGTDVTNKTYVDSVAGGGTVTSVDSSTGISWLTTTGGPITTSGTLELNGNFPGDGTLFLDGTGTFVPIPGSGSGVSQLISGGGVAWTGTGFNYIISAASYMINGTQYASPQTPVTLSAADPTEDRIDVFYVDDSGAAGVIEGTPGTPPVQPSVDPGSQLLLTFAYIVADTTEPVITNENIYLENTEYTMSTNAGTINLASTNNPYAGTKDIEGTATVAGNLFTGVKPSGTLDLSQYAQLTFQIRSKASWPNAKSMSIFWMNGGAVVGSSLALKNGTFGFDSSNTSSYQQIVIPAANFGTGTNPVDRLRVTVSGGGSSIGWYIDNIILQAGGGGGGGGGTVTNFTSGNLSPLFTTSVTNPTTTPNLAFTLSTAGANTHFANATGSTGAPSFTADAALTKSDDTNVTLTLGGSASTALLHATSLTLGWTGQLGLGRGGTAANLSDPGANRLWGWDDTDNTIGFWTIGTNLSYDHATHTLSASGTGIGLPDPVTYDHGGTGFTTVAQGDLIYGGSSSAWAKLSKDTNATRYLSNTGTTNNPAWAQVNLANGVTGILPSSNGGTGIDSSGVTNGQLLIGKTSDNSWNRATVTAGAGIQVTNGAGSITIANTGTGGNGYWDSIISVSGSDFTTSSTTLVDVTGLTFAAASGVRYEVECTLYGGGGASAAGVRTAIAFSGSNAASNTYFWTGPTSGTAATLACNALGTLTATSHWTAANINTVMKLYAVIDTTSTGNITVQAAKTTSGTATIYIGSNLKIRRLN